MDPDGRLRRALAAFGGGADVWDLVDAALASAARDRPAELRARCDGIVERLYAAAGRCRGCDAQHQPRLAEAEAAAAAASLASPDEEADVDGLDGADDEGGAGPGMESYILAIRDFLEDPDQLITVFCYKLYVCMVSSPSEDELVSLLQSLADMDITYKALHETDIGRHVNGLRKHPSGKVRQLVKLLVGKWKEIVDDWVRLHNSGGDGGSSLMVTPDKIQGRSYQNTQVSDFKYSPSSQRYNGLSSERSSNNNGVESMMEKRRTSPAPTYHNNKQNNSISYSTTCSSAPARTMREQKDTLMDLEKLDSARKRLQENYQEAQNAKKQRTIQVMDIHDIPKPKNRNAFIRKGGDGLPGKHPVITLQTSNLAIFAFASSEQTGQD
ncbi:hypothetical protein E2562_022463 [Oryza meyeriana var. granulata]|uniref:TFIIS N-terminal domain-containing protein n=1 Tax=Oryza meyeriana var. granulata TaxID=110450 RepID=A0A6G1BN32_9ORYZ|nr:hypothetical protein E2562_022463 [Oryza meyeriana var. granulata]